MAFDPITGYYPRDQFYMDLQSCPCCTPKDYYDPVKKIRIKRAVKGRKYGKIVIREHLGKRVWYCEKCKSTIHVECIDRCLQEEVMAQDWNRIIQVKVGKP